MSETRAPYGDEPLPDAPGDYDLSALPVVTFSGVALLNLLQIALPIAERYDKEKGQPGLFTGYINVMVESLEAGMDAPKGRGE